MKRSFIFQLSGFLCVIFPFSTGAFSQVLVDSSGEFDAFHEPAINDGGKVVFLGYKDVVGEEEQIGGIYTVTSGGGV